VRSDIHLTETENNPKRERWRMWKTCLVQEHQADTVPENPQDDGWGEGGHNKQ